jgi:uncharacterized membrane protein YqjE
MASERLKHTTLARALSDVVGDFADLLQAEMKLARVEITEKLSTKVRAGVWLGGAAILGFVILLLLVQAGVIWIASTGISLTASCLIVAGVLAPAAALAYFAGHAEAQESLVPERAIEQVNRDIKETKDRLS